MRSIFCVAILLSGCSSPNLASGVLFCGAGGVCPTGYHCAADVKCWKNGQDPDLGSATDLGNVDDGGELLCGASGQACCAEQTCLGQAACSGGSCLACGGASQPCCAGGSCTAGTVCNGTNCVACANCAGCGETGQPCCVSGTASSCHIGNVCDGDTCKCGDIGQPCCATGTACTAANSCCGGGNLCKATYRSVVLADNPDVYWRFEEPAGVASTAPAHGAGIGTFYGTTPGTSVQAGVTGALTCADSNRAVKTDGASGYINFGDIQPANFGTHDFTVEFWLKTTQAQSAEFILSKRDPVCTDGSFWSMQFYADASAFVSEVDQDAVGTNYGAYLTPALTSASRPLGYRDNQWHHVVYTRAGTTQNLFIDAVQIAWMNYPNKSPPTGTANITNTASFLFGNPVGCPNMPYFQGSIDELALYNGKAFTAAQAMAHYLAR